MALALGPDVDPAATWAGAALVTTSPSINPDYPTTEPRLRAALGGAGRGPGRWRPLGAGPRVRARPVPAAVRGPDDRGDRHEGQDHDRVAHGGDPRRRRGPSGRPRRQHRDPDRRAPRRADARPSGRVRAVRAAAADPVAWDDGGRLHERDVRPPGPARLARGVSGRQAAAGRAGPLRRRPRAQRRGPGRGGVRGPRVGAGRALSAGRPLPGGLGVVDGWIVAADVIRLALAGGGTARDRHDGRIMPLAELAVPGAHNVSNALAAVAVGLLVRRRARRDPRRPRPRSPGSSTGSSRSRSSMASASSTIRRARSPTR